MKVKIDVAWGEMDAYQHVNNAVFLRWFETARIAWFDEVRFPDDEARGPVLRAASVEFLRPVKHPDTVEVSVAPTRVGRSSVTLAYAVTNRANELVATGETAVVLFDFREEKSLELSAEARARIEAQLTS